MSQSAIRNPQSAIEPEPMLSPKQIGLRLGCSRDLVLDLIHRRQLPAICISKDPLTRKPQFRVSVADLQQFVECRQLGPKAKRLPRRAPYVRHV